MESIKIVWHDPNVFGTENSKYITQFLTQIDYRAFTTVFETVQFFSSTNDRWILVTSGTNGQSLVQQVHSSPAVIGIIIFCRSSRYHMQWSSAFYKVKLVESTRFKNVLDQAKIIMNQSEVTRIESFTDIAKNKNMRWSLMHLK
ncbi:unnamed protein product [Blepharisma stoltei]|uniref:Uncharacterized protein n=1 Tax=Blepharisma stoltei TaxID=1481888 RepID=A0AAU9IHJ0_9CILI|nr:unnamed protein product [Blepharisma stoltei]